MHYFHTGNKVLNLLHAPACELYLNCVAHNFSYITILKINQSVRDNRKLSDTRFFKRYSLN